MNSGFEIAGVLCPDPELTRPAALGAGLSQRLPPLSDSVSRLTEKPKNLRRHAGRFRIGNVVIGNCSVIGFLRGQPINLDTLSDLFVPTSKPVRTLMPGNMIDREDHPGVWDPPKREAGCSSEPSEG